MQNLKINIRGMHCRSCELMIEQNIAGIPGVKKVEVSHKTGVAEIFYEGIRPKNEALEAAVAKAGYKIGKDFPKKFFSRNIYDYLEVAILAALLSALYFWGKIFGVFDLSFNFGAAPGLAVVFLIGLTAGVSTCMAILGGLVLGVSARHAELHPEATGAQKFRPHVFFNIGRIVSFAFLGGLMGLVGSTFNFSGEFLSTFILLAGFAMLFMGFKLTELFPALSNFNLSLPKGFSRTLGIHKETKEYSHAGAAMLGALSFFLPCGFTQTIQLYAVSTGNFLMGASIMSIFALGTTPGLIGVGGISSAVKGGFARFFFKFVGLIVIVLGVINLQGGLNLLGFSGTSFNFSSIRAPDFNQVQVIGGKQVVKMNQFANGYSPNQFIVKKGVPVKWIITSDTIYTCASSLVVPSMDIARNLEVGENVVEFIPERAGNLRFTCAMGMFSGNFKVVD